MSIKSSRNKRMIYALLPGSSTLTLTLSLRLFSNSTSFRHSKLLIPASCWKSLVGRMTPRLHLHILLPSWNLWIQQTPRHPPQTTNSIAPAEAAEIKAAMAVAEVVTTTEVGVVGVNNIRVLNLLLILINNSNSWGLQIGLAQLHNNLLGLTYRPNSKLGLSSSHGPRPYLIPYSCPLTC